MDHPLKRQIVKHKKGITSVCSANKYVLEAAIENAKRNEEYVLIEATANQVNQFGGYTGMKPKEFVDYIKDLVKECNYDMNKVILGGDHLGPLTWIDKNEQIAMENAKELIRQFVLAGFTKIHIDTSMKVADDDKDNILSTETIARRGALLCNESEKAFKQLSKENPNTFAPVYVIGSEVPTPGGAQENNEGVQITKPEDFMSTVKTFEQEYLRLELSSAWDRVIAVVVQTGVEFSDVNVQEYNRDRAKELLETLDNYPNLVFEGHSTDYQTKEKLKQMVMDGIGILKVGPGLTFALREAVFSLEEIEKELYGKTETHLSNIKNVIENEMLKNPNYWKRYYHGSMDELILKRKYSLSDRIRYYYPNKQVDAAIDRLLENLNKTDIPMALLSQYMPVQYTKIRNGRLQNIPIEILKDRVVNCLDEYAFGCGTRE